MDGIGEIQSWAGWMAPWLIWGGTAVYIFKKDLRINPVPWLVWAGAVVIAAFNTIYVEQRISIQAGTFLVLGILYPAVVLRHRKRMIYSGLPRWQKAALPLLIASPAVSVMFDPYWGIFTQVTFALVTAGAFCQTALGGKSEESAGGWAVETIGGGLLALSTLQHLPQSIYAISGFLISGACLSCVLVGRGSARPKHAHGAITLSPTRNNDGRKPELAVKCRVGSMLGSGGKIRLGARKVLR